MDKIYLPPVSIYETVDDGFRGVLAAFGTQNYYADIELTNEGWLAVTSKGGDETHVWKINDEPNTFEIIQKFVGYRI